MDARQWLWCDSVCRHVRASLYAQNGRDPRTANHRLSLRAHCVIFSGFYCTVYVIFYDHNHKDSIIVTCIFGFLCSFFLQTLETHTCTCRDTHTREQMTRSHVRCTDFTLDCICLPQTLKYGRNIDRLYIPAEWIWMKNNLTLPVEPHMDTIQYKEDLCVFCSIKRKRRRTKTQQKDTQIGGSLCD